LLELFKILFVIASFFAQAAERFLPSEEAGFAIMGTIVSQDPAKSVVLIKHKSGKVNAYKLESLIDAWRLISIDKKYVVVTDGKERLQVWQDKFASEGKNQQYTHVPGTPAPKGGKFKEDGFERNDPGSGDISVKMTGNYRDKLIKQDLQKILMQATALPHYQDGAIVGFSLTQIDQDSVFAKGGFQDSDIISSVNNIPLNSIPGAIKLLNSLREAPSIEIEVMRDGVKRNIQLKVD
jgi:type II secretion system protein C